MGARPSTLDVTDVDLVAWLKAADGASSNSPTPVTSPLACVRALALGLRCRPPDAAFMARLREAPRLRQLTFDVFGSKHALWVLSVAFTFYVRTLHFTLLRVSSSELLQRVSNLYT
jgi:hypothetical protein